MGYYNAEKNGKDINNVKVKRNKARSVTDWLRGIHAGTLERRMNIYYDNIKVLNEDMFHEVHVDPYKMTRLEQLTKIQQLQNILINEQANSGEIAAATQPNAEGRTETNA